MLSKEEIENMKKYFDECIVKEHTFEEDLTIGFMKTAKEYIKQLENKLKESEERDKKLIEKLEEDIHYGKEFESDLEPTIPEIRAEYAEEILSIVRGEE